MKHFLLMSLLGVWLIQKAVAQTSAPLERKISGVVYDSSGKEGLPGVNIQIKGSSRGTITDIDGAYSIELLSTDQDAILVFSFTGFVTREVRAGNQSTVDINLEEDVKSLDEVVIVGYGTQKKSDLTGAIASVSGQQLRHTVTTNIDQALQGRVAGVQVTNNSGQPGGAVSIRIRGTSSITGSNEPLYVIDGIQFQGDGATSSGFDWGGGANGQTRVNPLAAISPNDIERIEVLKDASATAIYGSRAANGVVIITTKRGKAGEAKISYNGYYAVQTIPKKLDMMTLPDYAAYRVEVANELPGVEINNRHLDPSLLGRGTDWQDEIFRAAPMQNHQISVSGGNDKSTYAIMGGFFKQDGIIVGSGFERFNTRVNLDNQVKKWFKLGASLSFSNTNETITLNDGGDGVISQALQMPPDVPVRDLQGNYSGPIGQGSPEISANPVALALLRNNTLRRQRILANFTSDINIFEGLTLRTEYGFDNNHAVGTGFLPTYEWGNIINDVNELKHREESSFFWLIKNYLTYDKQIGSHHITAQLGTEAQKSNFRGIEFFKMNFASNDIQVPNQGENSLKPTTGWLGQSTIASYFNRINYNYGDRYLATFTFRADGSSKFGPNNRWGYFTSGSFAWRVMNESFIPSSNTFSDLKLRFGYGAVGNQAIQDYAFGSSLRNVNSAFGMGYINNRIANPNVQWESSETYNLGVDMSFWAGKVDLTAEVYKRFTSNMLLQVALPHYLGGGDSGIGAPFANVGEMQNQGVEVALTTHNIDGKKFTWKTDFNFTLNRNKVTHIDRPYFINLYWYSGFADVTRTFTGHPVGMFYGYVTEGLFTSSEDILSHAVQVRADGSVSETNPNGLNYVHQRDGVWIGDVKFKDINGDGVIDENDKVLIGDPNPKFSFGFNNSFSYKQFTLDIFLNGMYGGQIFNFAKYRNEGMVSAFNNQSSSVAMRARTAFIDPNGGDVPENLKLVDPNGTIPRFSQLDVNDNNRMSDRWIEDGSFVRIQNINLGYTLPQSISKRIKVERLKVYANVQNAFTFTKYSGYDPEIGAFNQDALRQNIDMGRYPTPRTFIFGLDIDF